MSQQQNTMMRRHINTDLEGGNDEHTKSDQLSTQHASVNMPNSHTPMTPPIAENSHNVALIVSDQDTDLARANRASGVPTNNHISDHI